MTQKITWKPIVVVLLFFAFPLNIARADCTPITKKKVVSLPDLTGSLPKLDGDLGCKARTQNELKKWIGKDLSSGQAGGLMNIISRCSGKVSKFQSQESCQSEQSETAQTQIEDPKVFGEIDDFLKNYEFISLDKMNEDLSQYQAVNGLHRAASLKKEEDRSRHGLKNKVENAVEGVLVDGPVELFVSAGITAAHEVSKLGQSRSSSGSLSKEASPQIRVNDLLPADMLNVRFVKGTKGTVMVLMGSLGMAAGAASAPWAGSTGAIPFQATGLGAEIALSLLEHNMTNQSDKRHLLILGSIPGEEFEIGAKVASSLLDPALDGAKFAKMAHYAAEGKEAAHAGLSKVGSLSAEHSTAVVLPFIGSYYLMAHGARELKRAIQGDEHFPHILAAFERLHQRVANQHLDQKRRDLIQHMTSLRRSLNSDEIMDREQGFSKLSCLCDASSDLDKLKEDAKKKFSKRIEYLENENKKISNLNNKKLKKRLKEHSEVLDSRNQALADLYKKLTGKDPQFDGELNEAKKLSKSDVSSKSADELASKLNQLESKNVQLLTLLNQQLSKEKSDFGFQYPEFNVARLGGDLDPKLITKEIDYYSSKAGLRESAELRNENLYRLEGEIKEALSQEEDSNRKKVLKSSLKRVQALLKKSGAKKQNREKSSSSDLTPSKSDSNSNFSVDPDNPE